MVESDERADRGEAAGLIAAYEREMGKRLVGRLDFIRGILAGVVAGGHVLLEGVPGLAKTLAVRSFADVAGLSFSRIQFTPDLLPADITGALAWEQATGKFIPRKGPIFANVILADELNRAPAKVQSALLEAMEEGQVTMGDTSHRLPEPFFVLATQNPIEHEGTWPLPEAELDRFSMKLVAGYPGAEEEERIVKTSGEARKVPVQKVLDAGSIAQLRRAAESLRCDEAILGYVVRLVRASRPGAEQGGTTAGGASGIGSALAKDIGHYVEFGASPRASIQLYRLARIEALFSGRDHVLPEDVKAVARPVLRHRLVLGYHAEADGVTADAVIARLLQGVALP